MNSLLACLLHWGQVVQGLLWRVWAVIGSSSRAASLMSGWVDILCSLLDYKGFPLPWSIKIFSIIKIGISFLYFYVPNSLFYVFLGEHGCRTLGLPAARLLLCMLLLSTHIPVRLFSGVPSSLLPRAVVPRWDSPISILVSSWVLIRYSYTQIPYYLNFNLGCGGGWQSALQGILKHAGLTGLL